MYGMWSFITSWAATDVGVFYTLRDLNKKDLIIVVITGNDFISEKIYKNVKMYESGLSRVISGYDKYKTEYVT